MTLKRSLAVVLLSACAPLAVASPFATETFDYPTGTLIGQNGGTGFAGAWTGSTSVGVFSPGLTYPGYNSLTNAVFTPGSNNGAFRQLTDAQGVGDVNGVVLAFLIQAPDGTDPDYAGLSLFQGNTEMLFIGKRSGQTTYGIERSGTSSVANSSVASSTSTHLLLTTIVFGSGSTAGNERIMFYVDPILNAGPLFPTLTLPDVPSFTFDNIRLQSGGNGESYNFDDIRMGHSLNDVVSTVPEPATASVIATGIFAALTARRRRGDR